MKTLTDLNQFANVQISVTDNRPANVLLSQVNDTTINIADSETTFTAINAYEINTIINSSVANVRLQLSVSSSLATVQWNTDPRFTIVQTGTTYTVTGINSDYDWNLIKNPTIVVPSSFAGVLTYSFSITYNTATETNIVVNWTVNKRVVLAMLESTANLSILANKRHGGKALISSPFVLNASLEQVALGPAGSVILYSSLTQNILTPTLFETSTTVGATWTFIVQAPIASINNITATGFSANSSYDSLTGVFTITGNRTLINQTLDAMRVTTTSLESNFDINYTVSNNITTDIFSITQQVINGNLLTYDLQAISNISCDPTIIKRIKTDATLSSTSGLTVGTNALSRIGTGCAEWTSNAQYLYIADTENKFDFGTEDFTVEGWYRFNSLTSDVILFGGPIQTSSFDFRRLNDNTIRVGRTNLAWDATTVAGLITTNTWTHLAVSRNNGFMRIFVNGVTRWSGTNTINYSISNTAYIGRRLNEGAFLGLADEIRVSSIARYTSDFTPSNTAFANDSFTKVLLHLDTSSAGVTPDDIG